MTVLNIAMIGSDDLAKSIAKATDQRDVHTYVHKESGPKELGFYQLLDLQKCQKELGHFSIHYVLQEWDFLR